MAGHRVMPVALNSLLCHISQKTFRVILHLHLKHMEDRIRIFRMMLQGNRRICNFLCVPPSNLPPAGSPFRQIFQADTQHCSLDALQSIIISDHVMIITHCTTLIFHHFDRIEVLFSIAGYTSAFSKRIQVFSRIKAKASEISQRSNHFPLI